MNKVLIPLVIVLGLALLGGGCGPTVAPPAGGAVQSGPQVKEDVPGPFYPLNINGPSAGEKACQFCKNGDNPVVMIFARSLGDPLTALIKKIDAATAAHRDDSMGSCVIFLSDDKGLPEKLKDLAGKEKIEHTVLAVFRPAGPGGYKINKDADVTVLLYTEQVVQANHAFAKGGLQDSDADKILADLPKILAKK
jgi:hypothetical protein